MFDNIMIYSHCPKCGVDVTGLQTKDLLCVMHTYRPLSSDWETSDLGKKFRQGLPVYPHFPFDKEHTAWKDQAERIEAQAMLPLPYSEQLKFVHCYTICTGCQAWLTMNIPVKDGKLWLPEKAELTIENKEEFAKKVEENLHSE